MATKSCESYPIGYFHIDVAEVRTEQGKLHMFVAVTTPGAVDRLFL